MTESPACEALLQWTTDDELTFMLGLFRKAQATGAWHRFARYCEMLKLRRWDETVDQDLLILTANQFLAMRPKESL